MLEAGKSPSATRPPPEISELSMSALLGLLSRHPAKQVVFRYEGRAIGAGYQITEVKNGSFVALDCGANPESWSELFIQLLDVAGGGAHMRAGKLAAIVGKVGEHFALEPSVKLTFEASDGVEPLRLFMASLSEVSDSEIRIDLSPRPASCKPRDRWLAQERAAAACCSGSKTDAAQRCCS